MRKISQSLLYIIVELYEQVARHTLIVTRDNDLKNGQARINEFGDQSNRDRFYQEFIGGALLGLAAEAAFGNLPWGLWFGDIYGAYIKFVVSVIILFLILCWIWKSNVRWKEREQFQRRIRRALQEITRQYSSHSAMNIRLQTQAQRRVAREVVIRPEMDQRFEELTRRADSTRIQTSIDELAEIDRQIAIDEATYNRQGGDWWLELLQATLRDAIPPIVCGFILSAQRGIEVEKWKEEALLLSDAINALHDDSLLQQSDVLEKIKKAINTVEGFNFNDFDELMKSCADAYGYSGTVESRPRSFTI